MRILFFIDTFSAGGKERRLMELMKGLKERPEINFELVIMSSHIHFIEVFDLGIKIHQLVRKTKRDTSIFKKIYQICKNYKPDFIHCWDSMSAIYLIPTLKLLHIKLVNGMVTDAPEKTGLFNKYWLRAQLTFPFSKAIIGNSQAGLSAYNAPAKKSICIRNGFNFKRTKTLDSSDEIRTRLGITTTYVVGMVASYSIYKDYETYFAASQLLLQKRKDITFLALGIDTDSDQAKNHIEQQYLDNFKLLGKRSGIESYINCMDVCVLATFTEGISNAILEYMALRKPVIATEGGGTNEIVEDKITGFLIQPRNAAALAEKMEFLLDDEALRHSMGEAGQQRIHSHFSIEKMVDDFVIAYKKIKSA